MINDFDIKQQKVKKGFNTLSPYYDSLSNLAFGKSLIHSQTYFINKLSKVETALILGGGTGTLLLELLKHDVSKSYCYLDISEKMIQESKNKVLKWFPEKMQHITFECDSYQKINSYDSFDLIITPYVLDCFSEEEAKEIMTLLHRKLNTNGQWLFADFNVSDKSKFASLYSKATLKILYIFFNAICNIEVESLPNFSDIFTELKLYKVREQFFRKGMLVSCIYERRG